MLINLNRLIRSEKGQTMVELALILPILCLLLLGMVEFGLLFHSHLVLANAAREGARAAAVGQTDSGVEAAVKKTAATLDETALVLTVDPGEGERARGQGVTVHLAYSQSLLVPFLGSLLPDPFPLQAATTMRVE